MKYHTKIRSTKMQFMKSVRVSHNFGIGNNSNIFWFFRIVKSREEEVPINRTNQAIKALVLTIPRMLETTRVKLLSKQIVNNSLTKLN